MTLGRLNLASLKALEDMWLAQWLQTTRAMVERFQA